MDSLKVRNEQEKKWHFIEKQNTNYIPLLTISHRVQKEVEESVKVPEKKMLIILVFPLFIWDVLQDP